MNIFIRIIKTLSRGLVLVKFFAFITLVVFIVLFIKGIIEGKKNQSIKLKEISSNSFDFIGGQASSFAWLFIILIIVTIPVSLMTNSAFQEIIGLHNLYLEEDGHYCYSVELYDYDSEQRYILPAEIEIDGDTWYLRKFVKPNGSVYVDDFFDQEISLQVSAGAYDDDGYEWGDIKLLNEHTVSKQLYETKRINPISVFSLLVTVVCCPFWLYILRRHLKKSDTN